MIRLLTAFRVLFLVLLVLVVYLSWKPSPSIHEVFWMPTALGVWFDQHDFWKNAIGYGMFGLVGFLAWDRPPRKGISPKLSSARRSFALLGSFCALALILELGQLALPRRVCDWADVLAAWAGIGLAWALLALARFFLASNVPRDLRPT